MEPKSLLQNARTNTLTFHPQIRKFPLHLCTDLFINILFRPFSEEFELLILFLVSLIYQIKVCLLFYLFPLITSTLCKRRGCYNVCCSVQFCSSNGYTEDERKFTVQRANDQRPMYYWPIATFQATSPFYHLSNFSVQNKNLKGRNITHPAQKKCKFCLISCTSL